MADFVKVASASEIPAGQLKGFTVNGVKILVANVSGALHCMGSQCTHKGGPLDEGDLSGSEVTCPWHGGTFDVTTGDATAPPAMVPAKKFEVKVQNGEIWVKV